MNKRQLDFYTFYLMTVFFHMTNFITLKTFHNFLFDAEMILWLALITLITVNMRFHSTYFAFIAMFDSSSTAITTGIAYFAMELIV